jgi:hypothetical protein
MAWDGDIYGYVWEEAGPEEDPRPKNQIFFYIFSLKINPNIFTFYIKSLFITIQIKISPQNKIFFTFLYEIYFFFLIPIKFITILSHF